MLADNPLSRVVDRVFEHALPDDGAVHAWVRCGSHRLRLSFASRALSEAFLPSFIRAPEGRADLAITFVTAAEVDLSCLIPHAPSEPRTLVSSDRYAMWQPGQFPMLHVLDRGSRRAFLWLGAGAAPPWALSRPVLPIIHAFTADTPWTALHGAAVGRQGRFLLLVGKGKAGKTTAALACARAGWDYAGDDYVFAHTLSGRIEPLYCSARLRADMTGPFADLLHTSATVSDDDGEARHELRLAACLKETQFCGGSLAAILLPRRRGAAAPEFAPARRSDAFAALLTITMMELPGWPRIVTERLTALIGLAPVFFVDTGPDPAAIPDAFAAFLERLQSHDADHHRHHARA